MTALFVKRIVSTNTATARGTLLLLHGWGFDHHCWQPLVPFLQQDYDLLLVDLPGFGHSAPLSVASADIWLEKTLVLLEQQIEAEVCNYRAVSVVGWSLGGQLALRLLQRNRQIQSVLGIATNLQFCANNTWLAAMDAHSFGEFLQNFSSEPEKTLKAFSRLVSAGDAHFLRLRKALPRVLATFNPSLASNWSFALQSLQLLDHTQAMFDRPVLLLLSENDALVPVSVAQTITHKQDINCHCLAQASHGHLLIEPELVAKLIVSFIDAQ